MDKNTKKPTVTNQVTKTCESKVAKPINKEQQNKKLDSKVKAPIKIDNLKKMFDSIAKTPINIDQLKKMFNSIVNGQNMDQLKKSLDWKAERPMKFPYTYCAKIRQFPIMHYYNNNWIWKYYVYGVIASLPIFWKIHRSVNSPQNKAKWKEIRRKEREHLAHRWD
ncbi:hypothetical protein WA026_006948 [Henosepilachna vigintioctopunctata]|uniref:ATP synthase protein 8 n=1 Tax=Henosepilachna vigintioctopunctata TaxID=420089 RepID=A0AAW1VBE9_9CUCU